MSLALVRQLALDGDAAIPGRDALRRWAGATLRRAGMIVNGRPRLALPLAEALEKRLARLVDSGDASAWRARFDLGYAVQCLRQAARIEWWGFDEIERAIQGASAAHDRAPAETRAALHLAAALCCVHDGPRERLAHHLAAARRGAGDSSPVAAHLHHLFGPEGELRGFLARD